jgi:hypothetical protein
MPLSRAERVALLKADVVKQAAAVGKLIRQVNSLLVNTGYEIYVGTVFGTRLFLPLPRRGTGIPVGPVVQVRAPRQGSVRLGTISLVWRMSAPALPCAGIPRPRRLALAIQPLRHALLSATAFIFWITPRGSQVTARMAELLHLLSGLQGDLEALSGVGKAGRHRGAGGGNREALLQAYGGADVAAEALAAAEKALEVGTRPNE